MGLTAADAVRPDPVVGEEKEDAAAASTGTALSPTEHKDDVWALAFY